MYVCTGRKMRCVTRSARQDIMAKKMQRDESKVNYYVIKSAKYLI